MSNNLHITGVKMVTFLVEDRADKRYFNAEKAELVFRLPIMQIK